MDAASSKEEVESLIKPSLRKSILTTLLLVGGCVLGGTVGCFAGIGIATVIDQVKAKHQAEEMAKSDAGLSLPVLGPALPVAVEPVPAVFSATFSTREPRQSVTRIAAAIPASGGRYEVEVRVTPSAGDQ
ncbi:MULTISPECIES: hypothetical protein [Cupriavidus]|jgi:hypothetical protein|uniref:hypothetical protein n=1 Tax=Cupriavidus TaxID=106589 RepID=UPI00126933F5|nr:hypothetical protein [Cupriavidus metallidurans]